MQRSLSSRRETGKICAGRAAPMITESQLMTATRCQIIKGSFNARAKFCAICNGIEVMSLILSL